MALSITGMQCDGHHHTISQHFSKKCVEIQLSFQEYFTLSVLHYSTPRLPYCPVKLQLLRQSTTNCFQDRLERVSLVRVQGLMMRIRQINSPNRHRIYRLCILYKSVNESEDRIGLYKDMRNSFDHADVYY